MFATGFDQADGLRRLFRPLVQARVDVLGLVPEALTLALATRIGESLRLLGLSVRWDDQEGLATLADRHGHASQGRAMRSAGFGMAPLEGAERLPGCSADAGGDAEVVISARQLDASQVVHSAAETAAMQAGKRLPQSRDRRLVCPVFVARAEPAQLPTLYGAMKAMVDVDRSRPLTVVWCDVDRSDLALRQLCEKNLQRTASRFLAQPIDFFHAPPQSDREVTIERVASTSRKPRFLAGLADRVLAHVGEAGGEMPHYQN